MAKDWSKHICQRDIIKRGWTRGMIEEYLIAPDDYRHARYDKYAHMYLLAEVEDLEARPDVTTRIAAIKYKRNPPRRDDKPPSGLRMAVPIPGPAPAIDISTRKPLAMAAHA